MIVSVQKYEIESPQYRGRMLSFAGVTGAAQEETITAPAVAGAAQGDFIILSNQGGATEALWLDIDADGTAPTAAAFLAADVRTVVSVSTGDTAAQVAAAIVAEITLADVTVTDNTDGTFEVVQDIYGDCEDAVVSNAAGSGAGSISAVVDIDGLDASLVNGKFDGTIAQTAAGVYTITFERAFLRAPEVVLTSKTDNLVGRVVSSAVGSCQVELQDIATGDATDGNFGVLVLGSDDPDFIR